MAGGTARQRRRLRRLGTYPARRADPKPERASTSSKKKHWPTKVKVWIGLATTALSLAGFPRVRDIYRPKFTVNFQPSLDPSQIFANRVVIRNTGSFDATNVQLDCNPTMAGSNSMSDVSFSADPILLLEPGGPGATVDCFHIKTDQLKPGDKLSLILSVQANYGYSWINPRIRRFFPFQAERDASGKVVYEEQP
jgi:hypothetical protein